MLASNQEKMVPGKKPGTLLQIVPAGMLGSTQGACGVLVEIFILPLCPGKSFESICMSDVIVSEMTNGILLALFVLCKRENECSGVEQASKILQQFSGVPQFASLSGHKGSTTLSRCPSRLRNRDTGAVTGGQP